MLISNFGCTWVFISIGMYLPTYTKEVLRQDISQVLQKYLYATPTINGNAVFNSLFDLRMINRMEFCQRSPSCARQLLIS